MKVPLNKLCLKRYLAPLIIVILCTSCAAFEGEEEQAVARVYDTYLYPGDLKGLVPAGTTREDSLEISNSYIDQWVRETVVLHQAELNLTDVEKDVERQLEEYRRSLIIFAYEKALIEQKLDTAVSIGEIEEYYLKNRKNFELKDYIVKVLYVKLDTAAVGSEDVDAWYLLENEEDWPALEAYCKQQAVNYYYDPNTWLYLDDLVREVPLKLYDKEAFLKENKTLRFEKDGYRYYLNLLDYKLRDNFTPLSLEKDNIRNIILQQRQRELIGEMRHDLYNDALNRTQIETY